MSELIASRNPMKFIKDNKNMSIKNLHGVAFAEGGSVPESLSDDDINKFLDVIRQEESSGGKDTAHRMIQSGIHEGDSAMGQYGLMPNTVSEMANRAKRQGIASPDELDAIQNPSIVNQNPELENQIAKQLAAKLLNQYHGNQEQAAYGWNQGHNLTPEQVQERDYQQHPYVQKFQKLKQLLNK